MDLLAPPADGRFARFRASLGRLRVLEAVLEPGDRLYVPPYWWHHVSVIGDASAVAIAAYSESTPMRTYEVLKAHPLPRALEVRCTNRGQVGGRVHARPSSSSCLLALRAYLLALAALYPPGCGVSSVGDASFACRVARRCVCFAECDVYEWQHGVMAREPLSAAPLLAEVVAADEPGVGAIRELIETRYRHLDDPAVVDGMGPMMATARRRLRASLNELERAGTPAADLLGVRVHARTLRERVMALPTKGDGVVSPAIWRTEMLSLVEDVASAVLGASEVEAALAWIAGEALLSGS